MILFLRFRSDSESALQNLADAVKVLQRQIPGYTLVESFKPLFQNEDGDDLPSLFDGFECFYWNDPSVREDSRKLYKSVSQSSADD